MNSVPPRKPVASPRNSPPKLIALHAFLLYLWLQRPNPRFPPGKQVFARILPAEIVETESPDHETLARRRTGNHFNDVLYRRLACSRL